MDSLKSIIKLLDTEVYLRINIHDKWYASLKYVYSKRNKKDCVLCGILATGYTPQQAIEKLCEEISYKVLVCKALSKDRKEITTGKIYP